MNPAVGIRPATAGDLDAVECVERRSFPEGEAFTRRQLRYLLTHAQGASYAATRDGGIITLFSYSCTDNETVPPKGVYLKAFDNKL